MIRDLSPREKQVARMLRDGYKRKDIAVELNMSLSTLKMTLHHIYLKMEVSGQEELVRELTLPLDSPLRKG